MTVTSGGATYVSQQVNKDGITSSYQVSFGEEIPYQLQVVGRQLSFDGAQTTTDYYLNSGIVESFSSTTDALGRITKISRSDNHETPPYVYDDIGRLTEKGYAGFTGETKLYKTTYAYRDVSLLQKTTQIASETFSYDNNAITYNYEYYPNGNVSKVYKGDTLVREYIYDEYDRLTWEKNFATSIAYNYEYDGSGNILAKRIHTISNSTVSENPTKTQEYVYETTNPDRLDYYQVKEGQAISYYQAFDYDALGNPTAYKGKTLEWKGRRLTKVGDTAMQYDYNGMRTRKGERYYYWLGNTLKMEYWVEGTEERYIYYFYDESGVSGFVHDEKEYYYHKNIFGDVIAIYDVNGNLQCTYEYDAWGNHTVTNATDDNIGNINPIRYRSYYWDADFNLYYLQSRYYSPELGRFISPDSVEYLAPDTIGGLNLYAYCMNNPTMYCDPTGHSLILSILIGAIIGAGIGFGGTVVADYVDDGKIFNGSINVGGYIANTLIGGLIGGFAGGIGASTFTFTYPTLGLATTSLGTTSIVVGSATATISGASVLAGVGLLGGLILFASHNRPGNNRVQNKQFKDAVKQAGYNLKDSKVRDKLNELHKYIRKNKLNLGWEELLELINEWLG